MKVSTKYDVGDKVWFMMGNKACSSIIVRVEYSKDLLNDVSVIYFLESCAENRWSANELFPSKEDLIKSL